MITFEEARASVELFLASESRNVGLCGPLVIIYKQTRELPWGWVFVYTRARAILDDCEDCIPIGKTPIAISKSTGQMTPIAGHYSQTDEEQIEAFERKYVVDDKMQLPIRTKAE